MNTVKDKDRRKRAINNEPYMLKKMLVDQRLLGNRNKIAHGERLETLDGISNANDYIDLHETMSQQAPDYEFEKVHPAVLFLHAHYVKSVDLLSKLDVAYQDILALDENDIQFID